VRRPKYAPCRGDQEISVTSIAPLAAWGSDVGRSLIPVRVQLGTRRGPHVGRDTRRDAALDTLSQWQDRA